MTDQVIYFEPTESEKFPFISEVEILLGGVGRLMFPDGTQQFIDDNEEPAYIFSPRLKECDLEIFCEINIERYRAFHNANSAKLLQYESVFMEKFWE